LQRTARLFITKQNFYVRNRHLPTYLVILSQTEHVCCLTVNYTNRKYRYGEASQEKAQQSKYVNAWGEWHCNSTDNCHQRWCSYYYNPSESATTQKTSKINRDSRSQTTHQLPNAYVKVSVLIANLHVMIVWNVSQVCNQMLFLLFCNTFVMNNQTKKHHSVKYKGKLDAFYLHLLM